MTARVAARLFGGCGWVTGIVTRHGTLAFLPFTFPRALVAELTQLVTVLCERCGAPTGRQLVILHSDGRRWWRPVTLCAPHTEVRLMPPDARRLAADTVAVDLPCDGGMVGPAGPGDCPLLGLALKRRDVVRADVSAFGPWLRALVPYRTGPVGVLVEWVWVSAIKMAAAHRCHAAPTPLVRWQSPRPREGVGNGAPVGYHGAVVQFLPIRRSVPQHDAAARRLGRTGGLRGAGTRYCGPARQAADAVLTVQALRR